MIIGSFVDGLCVLVFWSCNGSFVNYYFLEIGKVGILQSWGEVGGQEKGKEGLEKYLVVIFLEGM